MFGQHLAAVVTGDSLNPYQVTGVTRYLCITNAHKLLILSVSFVPYERPLLDCQTMEIKGGIQVFPLGK